MTAAEFTTLVVALPPLRLRCWFNRAMAAVLAAF